MNSVATVGLFMAVVGVQVPSVVYCPKELLYWPRLSLHFLAFWSVPLTVQLFWEYWKASY